MKIDKTLPVHYRYDSYASSEGVKIKLSRYYPVRETECFYFVIEEWQALINDPKQKRVGKNSLRKYCYPTMKDALESFKARQNSRIWHANYSLAMANQSLLVLENTEVGEFEELKVGLPEFLQDLHWDI